jgi:hypothetical protein
MEIEQRDVARYRHCKGMKLPAIVAELAAVFTKMHSTKTD